MLGAFGLASSPASALFFDDSAACVEGAGQVGMRAHRVSGINEARSCLVALEIPLWEGPWPGAPDFCR